MPVPWSRLTNLASNGLTIKLYPIFLNGCSHSELERFDPLNVLLIEY